MHILVGPLTAASLLVAHGRGPEPWPGDIGALAARSDSAYFGARAADALALCEGAFESGLESAQLRWRAARAAIAIGMMRPDGLGRREAYDRALVHARRGLDSAPTDVTVRYWLAAAAGRRANRGDPAYSARLAREVHEHVSAILAQDSSHAGAHHMLGKLHSEVLRAPALVRFIATRVLRVDLVKHASRAKAEFHLRRAVELEPEMILYLADLATFYERQGRMTEARDLAQRVIEAIPRHPMDSAIRADVKARWPVLALVERAAGSDQQRRGDGDHLADDHVAGVVNSKEDARRANEDRERHKRERQSRKGERVREGDGHRGAGMP